MRLSPMFRRWVVQPAATDKRTAPAALAAGIAVTLLLAPLGHAAELPNSTKAMLAELNKPESLLDGLDRELAVPPAWIEAARKEGALTINGTWDQGEFRKMMAPFVERYPFIKARTIRADRQDRVTKPLMAYTSGRVTTDVIGGVGARFAMFEQANAAMDLRDLPGWSNIPDGAKGANGGWIAQRMRYWCMAYNTSLIRKDELPKTWDELVTNPRLFGGKIGLVDRPNLWLGQLLAERGKDWTQGFMEKLFADVKPQLRKEGANAMVSLAVAGEFQISMPSASDRVVGLQARKAPIGWHCPEPVPAAVTGMLILNNNPHPFASKIFVNWLVSKEGQIAQYLADLNPPAHKDLQTRDFVELGEEVEGKHAAFAREEDVPWLLDAWSQLWTKSGGVKTRSGSEEE